MPDATEAACPTDKSVPRISNPQGGRTLHFGEDLHAAIDDQQRLSRTPVDWFLNQDGPERSLSFDRMLRRLKAFASRRRELVRPHVIRQKDCRHEGNEQRGDRGAH